MFVEDREVDASRCSVKCSISWPFGKQLKQDATIEVVVGDTIPNITKVIVGFRLFKNQKENAKNLQTNQPKFTQVDASPPYDLWCPAEDTFIYLDSGAFVMEVE